MFNLKQPGWRPGIDVQRRRESGVTLVDTLMGLMLFSIGTVAVLGVMVQSFALSRTNRETELAMRGAHAMIESIRSEPFGDIVASFNADGSDDPDGANTSEGRDFDIDGLDPAGGETACGTILLPLDANGLIDESLDMPELGLPRDLDGDGQADDTPAIEDCLIVPVLVRVRWNGFNGDREMTFATVLRQ